MLTNIITSKYPSFKSGSSKASGGGGRGGSESRQSIEQQLEEWFLESGGVNP